MTTAREEVRSRLRELRRRASIGLPWLLVIKATAAATLAWVVATYVLRAPAATFAPFTAVLMMQDTVTRAFDHAARYTAAMLGGVAVAGLVSSLLQAHWWTFGLVVFAAMLVGRWRRLGSYGVQVAVAAMFAHATLIQPGDDRSNWASVAGIAGMVLLGCASAVLVNMVLFPPLRYQTARRSVAGLADETESLLRELAEQVGSEGELGDGADSWSQRADDLPTRAVDARRSADHAAESGRWNPRRLLLRGEVFFDGYRTAVRGLHRITGQLRLVVSDLREVEREGVLGGTAEETSLMLSDVAEVARALGELDSARSLDRTDDVDAVVRRCDERCGWIGERGRFLRAPGAEASLALEALHIDLHRLVEECGRTRDELKSLSERVRG